ncbi:hypothetical protein SAMN05421819_1883 [Bryocella elongata]|uniref:ABC-three component systems C-terminal domain-containing protein n=1 Tax=Bryocella elongata TaxID=863522 RepID=A0A1H5XNA5_9BACT|nr:ABC-three component system protein [Bryocella elongata]SEG12850.1 hypothetical protein SAMN05421819_1883 [Bryocella elongata]
MRAWYELKFNDEFRSRTGTEFQSLFSAIMERRYPGDFRKVKPYGNQGDHKCDGYHASKRRVYQVYAPETFKATVAKDKIDEDFTGAVAHWSTLMGEWVFVHNQHKSGLPPQTVKHLQSLNGSNGVSVESWCDVELRNEFFSLQSEDQAAILGHTPTDLTFKRLDIKDVIVVVNALAQQEAPVGLPVAEVAPGKLEANQLSDYTQSLLTMGSRKAHLVKKLFDKWHDPELGDRVAATFHAKYLELRDSGESGDDLLTHLWHYAGGGSQDGSAKETAVLALLAFLFEECEIFEPVKESEPS